MRLTIYRRRRLPPLRPPMAVFTAARVARIMRLTKKPPITIPIKTAARRMVDANTGTDHSPAVVSVVDASPRLMSVADAGPIYPKKDYCVYSTRGERNLRAQGPSANSHECPKYTKRCEYCKQTPTKSYPPWYRRVEERDASCCHCEEEI